MNVYLVGMPGSGKSAVGRELARLLTLPFRDLDAEVEDETGEPIPDIFERGGEPAFRLAESRALAEAAAGPPSVVACGGGVVIDPANRALLATTGTVVYLQASLSTLRARVGIGANRPLLSEEGDVARLLEERAALYEDAADHVVSSDGPVGDVVSAVREAVR